MNKLLLPFITIILTGILSGILLGIWIGYNPATFSYPTYLEYQQGAIRSLNVLMPILGLVSIILTIALAFSNKINRGIFSTLLFAGLLLIIAGLITRFGNQPLNTIVMTWNVSTPPVDWTQIREKWWAFHQIRSISALVAFALIVLTILRRKSEDKI